jgi:hypothetical protein
MSMVEVRPAPAARAEDRWAVHWPAILTGLVVLRVLVPLLALAATGASLPLLPRYDYVPLNGDANGYYEAITNLFDSFRAVLIGGVGVVVVVAMAASVLAARVLWRRGLAWVAVLLPALALSLAVTLVVRDVDPPGAAVIGWPLAWGALLFPLPALGLELTPDRAFPVGLALGLVANGVTTVATAYLGLRATGHRSVGLLAAGLYSTWPVWVGLVAGDGAWENGQWNADVGLHLYTEPLSTALVTASLATILSPSFASTPAAASGLALGFATVVKLTNGLVGLVLVPLVALRYGLRRTVPFVLGGLVSAPILIAYWPKGYVKIFDGDIAPVTAYSLDYVSTNLRDSTIFTPAMLLVLVPLALFGIVGVDGWFPRGVLVAPVVVTVLGVVAYFATYQHPRFYYAILPCVFVLQAAGARLIARGLLRPTAGSPA